MKLLTLISGKTVHLTSKNKIIPKDEFSELITAQELLEKIKEEGRDYRKEITKEGETLFAESKKKGFEEGLAQWAQQLKLLEDERSKVKKELQKFIAQVALTTAKKIVGREIEQNPSTLSDIILTNLRSVSSHHRITIFVNKNDLEKVNEHREKLKKIFDKLDSFIIQARDDVSEGGAIIETESGIIDARAESLWLNVEKAFEELIKPKS